MTNVNNGIEVQARREALGLTQPRLAEYLGVAQPTISSWERGTRKVPPGILAEIEHLEERYSALEDAMCDVVESMAEPPVLITHATDESFWAAHPEHEGLPAVLHRVACARVAYEYGGLRITTLGG